MLSRVNADSPLQSDQVLQWLLQVSSEIPRCHLPLQGPGTEQRHVAQSQHKSSCRSWLGRRRESKTRRPAYLTGTKQGNVSLERALSCCFGCRVVYFLFKVGFINPPPPPESGRKVVVGGRTHPEIQ